jgi:integrase
MMRTILRLMRPCKTRYRLELMMVAGLAPKQIMGIRPEHVDLVHMDVANGIAGTVWIGRREKGKKTAGFVKPLSEEGANALRRFMAWDCWGTYSASSAGKSFRRCSADKLLLADLRPYDFRHSYITEAYRATGDLRATQILAGHASIEITARYALGAVDERVKIAFAAFSQTQKLPVRVTSHGKSL